jgi:hypothetical protein
MLWVEAAICAGLRLTVGFYERGFADCTMEIAFASHSYVLASTIRSPGALTTTCARHMCHARLPQAPAHAYCICTVYMYIPVCMRHPSTPRNLILDFYRYCPWPAHRVPNSRTPPPSAPALENRPHALPGETCARPKSPPTERDLLANANANANGHCHIDYHITLLTGTCRETARSYSTQPIDSQPESSSGSCDLSYIHTRKDR